jgi:uncharacterized protein (AIM24 family)
MAERDAPRPPSSRSRDVAGEDFLFHLYRGSELLQDNRVHDAKAELEQALSLQPSDPKGQDLLGIVYFRLGLYPRAIAIYEQLIKLHPDALEPRINLALSYLKTGQPAQARFELEKVVEQSPGHSRAWGYLGLAFQRLGDYERASYAFQAGGHDGMARRLIEMAATGGALSIRPEPPAPTKAEMRRVAGDALVEMEREAPFHTDEGRSETEVRIPAAPATPSGTWQAVEPGRDAGHPGREAREAAPVAPVEHIATFRDIAPSLAPAYAPSSRAGGPGLGLDAGHAPAPASLRTRTSAPRRAADAAREALLVFPRDLAVSLHASGLVLVQASNGFAARLEAVRSLSYSGGQESAVLQRRTRGRVLDEPLGGPASPLVELGGKVGLALGPSTGQRLWPVALEDEAIYLREDALLGFETGVTHENGRLPVGDGDSIPMVQLRGPGAVVATVPVDVAAIEVGEGRTTAVRAVSVLGWIGRVVPRGLLPSEAPGGARGFVAFVGEGMVLVDGR